MIRRHLSPDDDVDVRRFVNDDGLGPSKWFGKPGFSDAGAARAAWERSRPAVWAATRRGCVPHAAVVYDRLQATAHDYMWAVTACSGVPRSAILRLVAADRLAVDRFEERDPLAAHAIANYLAVWRADLDALGQLARIAEPFAFAHAIYPRGSYGLAVRS